MVLLLLPPRAHRATPRQLPEHGEAGSPRRQLRRLLHLYVLRPRLDSTDAQAWEAEGSIWDQRRRLHRLFSMSPSCPTILLGLRTSIFGLVLTKRSGLILLRPMCTRTVGDGSQAACGDGSAQQGILATAGRHAVPGSTRRSASTNGSRVPTEWFSGACASKGMSGFHTRRSTMTAT